MSGAIPTQIGQLGNLIGLAVIACGISDPIPVEIFSIHTLNNLLLERNHLSRIPEEICSLTSLHYLTLTDNPALKCVPQCITNRKSALPGLGMYAGPEAPCDVSTSFPSPIPTPSTSHPTGAPSVSLFLPYLEEPRPTGHPTPDPGEVERNGNNSSMMPSNYPTAAFMPNSGNSTTGGNVSDASSCSQVPTGSPTNAFMLLLPETPAPTCLPTAFMPNNSRNSTTGGNGSDTSSSSQVPTGSPTNAFMLLLPAPTGFPTVHPLSDDSNDDALFYGNNNRSDDSPGIVITPNSTPTGHPTMKMFSIFQPSVVVFPTPDDDSLRKPTESPSPSPSEYTVPDSNVNQGAVKSDTKGGSSSNSTGTWLLIIIVIAIFGGAYVWCSRYRGRRRSRDFHSSRIKGIIEGGRSSRSDVEINLWNDGDEEDITPSIGTTSRKQKKFSLGLGSGKPNRREYAPLEIDDTD